MISKNVFIVLMSVIGLSLSTNLSALSSKVNRDQQVEISKAQIRLMVDNIVQELNQSYIYPQKAQLAATSLIHQLNVGAFDDDVDFLSFRQRLLSILTKATNDSGFDLVLLTEADQRASNDLQNAAISAEVLDNNIGYLQISGDFNFPQSTQLIEQYFSNIAEVDGLIIDLRSIDKGSVELTQKMIGFFVEPNTVIGNLLSNDRSDVLKATQSKGFEKFKHHFPLYILNSSFVTGHWELFSHSLQLLDKAIVVGQTTMGVDFVNTSVRVADNIDFDMISGVITGPDTTDTWRDQGVEPDHYVQSDEIRQIKSQLNHVKLKQVKQDKVLKKAYDLVLKHMSNK